jgi:hypothetical protein
MVFALAFPWLFAGLCFFSLFHCAYLGKSAYSKKFYAHDITWDIFL